MISSRVRTTRRQVLGAAAIAAVGCRTVPSTLPPRLSWGWTGAVTTSGAKVVTRFEGAVDATLEVDRDRHVSPVRRDDRGVFTFELTDLDADRRYPLHVRADTGAEWIGAVRTFPEERPTSFKFVAGSCCETGSAHPVFETMRRHDPRVFVQLGDLHYEDIDEDSEARFRAAYDVVLTSKSQSSLYREVPVAYVWDDHDFGRNNSDRTSASRNAANAAYRACVPHHPLISETGVFHAFTVGRVRFLMTDCRSQRTPRGVAHRYRTMLGAKQKAWLKEELLASKGRYALVVWVSPVGWIGATLDDDAWPGYPGERAELALFLAEHGIDNVLMLAGDAHMLAIDDGRNNRYGHAGHAQFPVFHVAALDQGGSEKGGPYSHGVAVGRGQFGLVEVEDRTHEIEVRLTGRDAEDTVLLEHTFVLPG
jgi:phosphodiesterase/alkaline phosphatase D-like protein